jgi:hypothetical protein
VLIFGNGFVIALLLRRYRKGPLKNLILMLIFGNKPILSAQNTHLETKKQAAESIPALPFNSFYRQSDNSAGNNMIFPDLGMNFA